MKTTITILIAIMALSLISAGCSDVTAGESCTIQLDDLDSDEEIVYTVSGNSSNLEGMDISINNTNVTLKFDKRYKADSFTLIFMNKQEKVIHKHHYHGGGGGDTDTVVKYKNRTINNTEIIEIPCNETNQTQKDNETDDKEPKPEKEDDNLFWRWIIFGFVALLLIILILREFRKPAVGSNNQKDERRLNDNGRKEQEETEE